MSLKENTPTVSTKVFNFEFEDLIDNGYDWIEKNISPNDRLCEK